MNTLTTFLSTNGGVGMFVAAFLAGSVFPFSSEAVMLALLAAGADAGELLVWGTAGNTLGSLFNYGIGSLGKQEWIDRVTKAKPERLDRAKRWVRRYGAWAGLLAWLPIIGSILTVAMGYLRVKLMYALITVAIGKYVRYWLIIKAYGAF